MKKVKSGLIEANHPTLDQFFLAYDKAPDGGDPLLLFTENESNVERLWNAPPSETPYYKDGFHEFVIHGDKKRINWNQQGTKAAPLYDLQLNPGESRVICLRLFGKLETSAKPLGTGFDSIFALRKQEADEFYESVIPASCPDESKKVMRQAYGGLLWNKQFYHYIVKDWLKGDPAEPQPPPSRKDGRNTTWGHLYARDVLSMPDNWEYPWFAAWDLGFHMLPYSQIDPVNAKQQLSLLVREWYMSGNGQLPAYEFKFSDVNPPVHAWAAWRVYKISGKEGQRDRTFLESLFQKLLLNFTWWTNQKDPEGNNLFGGGFLGLDNIGVFDRSKPLPNGGYLQQADGTAWMAFNCLTMLVIAIELAQENHVYEDMASKFFEHFIAISDAINTLGGHGLWDETDGFYYDQLKMENGTMTSLKSRSLVGLIPLLAVELLDTEKLARLPGFTKRMDWFLKNRPDLVGVISACEACPALSHKYRILAIPSKERLERTLTYMLDENEFLSPYGVRSVSRIHRDHPYIMNCGGQEARVDYVPGESNTRQFGGNSNWRGPVWFPINYLLIETLERYHLFYGDRVKVECPKGSGNYMNLLEVSRELARRLSSLFLPDENGMRPSHGGQQRFASDPHWKDLILFHEFFHGDNGKGLGASHQTGWTSLVIRCLECLEPVS
jgi:Glycosyl hydrolase family 63 C-terminal domain